MLNQQAGALHWTQ